MSQSMRGIVQDSASDAAALPPKSSDYILQLDSLLKLWSTQSIQLNLNATTNQLHTQQRLQYSTLLILALMQHAQRAAHHCSNCSTPAQQRLALQQLAEMQCTVERLHAHASLLLCCDASIAKSQLDSRLSPIHAHSSALQQSILRSVNESITCLWPRLKLQWASRVLSPKLPFAPILLIDSGRPIALARLMQAAHPLDPTAPTAPSSSAAAKQQHEIDNRLYTPMIGIFCDVLLPVVRLCCQFLAHRVVVSQLWCNQLISVLLCAHINSYLTYLLELHRANRKLTLNAHGARKLIDDVAWCKHICASLIVESSDAQAKVSAQSDFIVACHRVSEFQRIKCVLHLCERRKNYNLWHERAKLAVKQSPNKNVLSSPSIQLLQSPAVQPQNYTKTSATVVPLAIQTKSPVGAEPFSPVLSASSHSPQSPRNGTASKLDLERMPALQLNAQELMQWLDLIAIKKQT